MAEATTTTTTNSPASTGDTTGTTTAKPDTVAASAAATDASKEGVTEGDKQGTTDTKPKDGKADEGPKGAPEKYTDFKLPEGFEMSEAGKPILEKFSTFAREANLTQDQAQKFMDLYAEVEQTRAKSSKDTFEAMNAEWRKQTETDKEFGGEKLKENLGFAAKAIEAFAGKTSAEFKDALNVTGIGNHPAMVRFLIAVGKAVGQDKLIFGRGASDAPANKSAAEQMFPSLAPKK